MSLTLGPTPTSLRTVRRIRLAKPATEPQQRFWSNPAKFRGFVGGVGSGKTRAGVAEVLRMPPGSRGAVVAPTYPMLRDETLRTFLIVAQRAGLMAPAGWHASDMRAVLIDGKEVLFRSADDPDRLRGPNLGWFWLDEAAFMDEAAWLIMIGRLRRAPGRGWLTTTPDGLNWVHRRFTAGGEDYALINSPTKANFHLPPGFVESLERSYSADYARQELGGEFVDLAGAGLFMADRIQVVDSIPDGMPNARAWDLAATKGPLDNEADGPDFTAGVLLCGPDRDDFWYIADMVRGRWDTAERDGLIRQTAEADTRTVRVAIPLDPGQAGKGQALALDRLLTGFRVTPMPVTRDKGGKVTRAGPFSSKVNAGKVRCLRAKWTQPLIDELRMFPRGKHDDQVDALSDAFELLAKRPVALASLV